MESTLVSIIACDSKQQKVIKCYKLTNSCSLMLTLVIFFTVIIKMNKNEKKSCCHTYPSNGAIHYYNAT